VLEDGRITAIGPHDELLGTSPTYQRLHQLQFMDAPEQIELAELDPSAQYPLFEQAMTTKAGE
jgi:subfamily B ATP-binding cassette protein MsbA